ncbi:transposase [Flavobacterium oncorhynchi]|uniref:transposase n=1 Tax=Flavobacterium oncorhynchi TaxID=728056 RepID=UPI00351A1311
MVVDEFQSRTYCENQTVRGIDMRIKCFLTSSEGCFIQNLRKLELKLRELLIQSRKLSHMKKRQNFAKQVMVLHRLHQKVKRSRLDFLQEESTRLTSKYHCIVKEDFKKKKYD